MVEFSIQKIRLASRKLQNGKRMKIICPSYNMLLGFVNWPISSHCCCCWLAKLWIRWTILMAFCTSKLTGRLGYVVGLESDYVLVGLGRSRLLDATPGEAQQLRLASETDLFLEPQEAIPEGSGLLPGARRIPRYFCAWQVCMCYGPALWHTLKRPCVHLLVWWGLRQKAIPTN